MLLKESQRFPKSYGDLALQSSDGVLCYFPKHVLIYMSPAFHEMLNVSPDSKDVVQCPLDGSPIELTETSVVLENFLAHIDPKTLDPCAPMDVATIEQILAAAHKYQVDIIIQRFEKEVLQTETSPQGAHSSPSKYSQLLKSNPLLILCLGEIYELPHVCQKACTVLASCPHSSLKPETVTNILQFPTWFYVRELRGQRISRYKGYIKLLSGNKGESDAQRVAVNSEARAERGTHPAEAQSTKVRPHHEFTSMNYVLQRDRKICLECSDRRIQWIQAIPDAVSEFPCWASFWRAYRKGNVRCEKCDIAWPEYFSKHIDKWREESEKAEAQQPQWPPTGSKFA
ncbi:hypothetical protein CPB86DRAFT_871950 [Serendipita vermifera]|nr:hypothetical protein CPB86DRAFT_871950 [Serendipita vermifera]